MRDDLSEGGSRYLVRIARFLGPDAGVVERQLPFLFLYAVAMLSLLSPSVPHTVPWAIDASVAAVLLQVVLARALPWGQWPVPWQDVLPVLQIVAIALLRYGTGGVGSFYTTMVFLPVIALAAQPGRRGVVISAVGMIGVVLLPVLVDDEVEINTNLVIRSLYLALVAVVVAVTVDEITDRLRARTASVDTLRASQEALLERTRADALELARVANSRRAARDQLVSVIDSATEQAIIATDATGLVEVFNAGAERLLGYGEGEVVHRMRLTDFHVRSELDARRRQLFQDTSSVDEPSALLAPLVAPALAGRPEMRNWTYERRDGTQVLVRLAVTRRAEADGTVTGYVVVATDITEEQEAARLKDEFVSLVSHELRTPLTSVLGYLELLQDGTDPLTDEQREYVEVIERNARRQLRLVGDLLLTAQVDAGTFAIAPQPVDLADVVRASALSAAPAAEQAGVTLEVAAQPSPTVADAQRISQAVDNLVSNALKFTPAGGKVVVECAPTVDGGVRVAVSDTGIGIAPDELGRLTTRFFRATTATRRAIPGVGLGLAITKAVVEAHGGTLDILSAVGEGTTFAVVLPATPSA
ncbi:ATP-binding protein [Cellulomonas sp.]|uniref:sensor histidine kinase n=1 Tax=Cellulomonas sp. TaxID=40001 RepID=UPI0025C34368|nr:ATP-binding protein [Cellulomonas sp.]